MDAVVLARAVFLSALSAAFFLRRRTLRSCVADRPWPGGTGGWPVGFGLRMTGKEGLIWALVGGLVLEEVVLREGLEGAGGTRALDCTESEGSTRLEEV